MSTKNIMIVGVGGQGTLLASRILGNAVIRKGYDVKVSEVHGMSQRGGSVVTYVKFGDAVYSPIIDKGEADIILAFECLEAYRALPWLKKGGVMIVNDQQINPMPVITGAADYPEKDGEFIVKVEDDLPTVDGTFKVTYGGGNCTVTRGDFAPDLVLSSGAFSRLIYGYDGVNAEAAKYMDGVRIENDATDFFRVFTRKPCGIFEHF